MEQALHAAAEIDEGAELAHRDHTSRQHRAGDDRAADFRGVGSLFLFEQRAARDDEVAALVLVLDDPECVDLADVRFGVGGPHGVDLRQRTERALRPIRTS